MAPRDIGPPNTRGETDQAASGRPIGVGHATFGDYAEALQDNGYEPLPIIPGAKRPAPRRWTSVQIDRPRIASWGRDFCDHGIGLRTGALVAIDIDILDPDLAHRVMQLAFDRFGPTLMRVGRWPKRLLIYRAREPFRKIDAKPVEVLGLGQQFVAFGLHPDTGRPYDWPLGETPLDVPLDALPPIDQEGAEAFVAEARRFCRRRCPDRRVRAAGPARTAAPARRRNAMRRGA